MTTTDPTVLTKKFTRVEKMVKIAVIGIAYLAIFILSV